MTDPHETTSDDKPDRAGDKLRGALREATTWLESSEPGTPLEEALREPGIAQ